MNEELEEVGTEVVEGTQEVSATDFTAIGQRYKAGEGLTDKELDMIADLSNEILRNLLSFFDAGDSELQEFDGEEGELILDIANPDLAILIGRHGTTLDALQFLFTSLLNRRLGFRYPVVIDIEGYKNRRKDKLEENAISAAKKAVAQGRTVKLHPMSPYERRVVHVTLRNFRGVDTHSEGEEPQRRIVIVPVK